MFLNSFCSRLISPPSTLIALVLGFLNSLPPEMSPPGSHTPDPGTPLVHFLTKITLEACGDEAMLMEESEVRQMSSSIPI